MRPAIGRSLLVPGTYEFGPFTVNVEEWGITLNSVSLLAGRTWRCEIDISHDDGMTWKEGGSCTGAGIGRSATAEANFSLGSHFNGLVRGRLIVTGIAIAAAELTLLEDRA